MTTATVQPIRTLTQAFYNLSLNARSQRHEGISPHTLRQSPMTLASTLLTRLLAPYAVAAAILATATRNTWHALRSDRAMDIYRTIAILIQVAGWLAFLACLYTLQAGRAARRVYEAQWAPEANTLAQPIDHALAPADGGDTLPLALERPQADVVTAFLDNAIDLDTAATLLDLPSTSRTTSRTTSDTTIHPDQVQAILNGSGTATNKLRNLANLANIQWRHSRGHKKHMRNSDIRSALATVLPADILAQLS